jgi:hypothetical protein
MSPYWPYYKETWMYKRPIDSVLLPSGHFSLPALEAAIKTLFHLGYSWTGGEQWKPELGKPPRFLSPKDSVLIGGYMSPSQALKLIGQLVEAAQEVQVSMTTQNGYERSQHDLACVKHKVYLELTKDFSKAPVEAANCRPEQPR